MSYNAEHHEKDAWSPTLYNTNASFVYSKQYTSAVLGLLDPKPGEKIIDFGCGTGEVTRRLQQTVGKDGLVVGTDFSQNLVSSLFLEASPCGADETRPKDRQSASKRY